MDKQPKQGCKNDSVAMSSCHLVNDPGFVPRIHMVERDNPLVQFSLCPPQDYMVFPQIK